jgi:hypothetical protein
MAIPWDLIDGSVDVATLAASAFVALLIIGFAPRLMRTIAIWIGQYAAFVGLVLTVVVAGRTGYTMGGAMALANNFNQTGQLYYSLAGAASGGVLGFAAAALALAFFFVLFEIAANSRRRDPG